jgi:hypothetical protein
MRRRAGIPVAAAVAAVLILGSTERASPTASTQGVPQGKRVGCSERSQGNFPGAFNDRNNLVVGPLAMLGGARYTRPRDVRRHGGQKYPLLVRVGRTVTVHLPESTGNDPGLAYGRSHDNPKRTLRFVACRRGPGPRVTFWSGFVRTRTPNCVPLEIYVGAAPAPRSRSLALGARCPD